MGNVAIVTDSTANIPDELVQELNIHVVPVWLYWQGQGLRDGLDITAGQLYRLMREDKHLPSTAAPSVGDFLSVYTRLSREAEGIVSIHVSSELSGIYNAALTAAKLVENVSIQVVDSRSGAMGHGFVILEAARVAAAGRPLEEVVAKARDTSSKVNVLVTLDTLEYLHRGGRVPAVAALVGSLLKINPIVYITRDGHADVLERPRTKAMAVRRMVEIMEQQVGSNPVHAAVVHADALEEAERLKEELASRFHCLELLLTEFTPVMGAHTGPGVLGVVFYME